MLPTIETSHGLYQDCCRDLPRSVIDETGAHREKTLPSAARIDGDCTNIGGTAAAFYRSVGKQGVPLAAHTMIVKSVKRVSCATGHDQDDSTILQRCLLMPGRDL